MIELTGQRNIRERIKDEGLNIKATERDLTPNNHEQSVGRKQGLQFAEEQAKSDLRAIKEWLGSSKPHFHRDADNQETCYICKVNQLISAINSAIGEVEE